jgi:hypothetical protein
MIYDCLSHDEAERLEFCNVLIGLVQPLIESVAKVRFARNEAFDRLRVLSREPNDDPISPGHARLFFSTAESAEPTA